LLLEYNSAENLHTAFENKVVALRARPSGA
jgi:hypothetical protein